MQRLDLSEKAKGRVNAGGGPKWSDDHAIHLALSQGYALEDRVLLSDTVDMDAYDKALQKARLNLAKGGVVFKFDPRKHPRGLMGRFIEVVGGLQPGQRIDLPDGTTVKREQDFMVHGGPNPGLQPTFTVGNKHQSQNRHQTHDAGSAAWAAMATSAMATKPESIGGPEAVPASKLGDVIGPHPGDVSREKKRVYAAGSAYPQDRAIAALTREEHNGVLRAISDLEDNQRFLTDMQLTRGDMTKLFVAVRDFRPSEVPAADAEGLGGLLEMYPDYEPGHGDNAAGIKRALELLYDPPERNFAEQPRVEIGAPEHTGPHGTGPGMIEGVDLDEFQADHDMGWFEDQLAERLYAEAEIERPGATPDELDAVTDRRLRQFYRHFKGTGFRGLRKGDKVHHVDSPDESWTVDGMDHHGTVLVSGIDGDRGKQMAIVLDRNFEVEGKPDFWKTEALPPGAKEAYDPGLLAPSDREASAVDESVNAFAEDLGVSYEKAYQALDDNDFLGGRDIGDIPHLAEDLSISEDMARAVLDDHGFLEADKNSSNPPSPRLPSVGDLVTGPALHGEYRVTGRDSEYVQLKRTDGRHETNVPLRHAGDLEVVESPSKPDTGVREADLVIVRSERERTAINGPTGPVDWGGLEYAHRRIWELTRGGEDVSGAIPYVRQEWRGPADYGNPEVSPDAAHAIINHYLKMGKPPFLTTIRREAEAAGVQDDPAKRDEIYRKHIKFGTVLSQPIDQAEYEQALKLARGR